MHHLTAADGLVITMLGVMLLSFGVVAMLLYSIRRNMNRHDPQVDALIEEVAAMEAADEKSSAVAVAEMPRQPWEKDGDWWKS